MNPYEENKPLDLLNEESEDNAEFLHETESEEEIEDEIPQDTIFDTPVIEKIHSAPRPKKVLSEEHKAKLQAGRLRALENRRANARQNKEMRALSKKKQQLEYDNLKHEVDDLEYKNPTHEEESSLFSLSEAQLIDLQEKAVEKYDIKRKQRKAEKKDKQHSQKINQFVNSAQSNVDNAWAMYLPQ